MSDETKDPPGALRPQPEISIHRLLDSLRSCESITGLWLRELPRDQAAAYRMVHDIATNARCLVECVKELEKRIEELEGARPTGGPK